MICVPDKQECMTCNYTTAADSGNDENAVEKNSDLSVSLPQPSSRFNSSGKERKKCNAKRPVLFSDLESDDSDVKTLQLSILKYIIILTGFQGSVLSFQQNVVRWMRNNRCCSENSLISSPIKCSLVYDTDVITTIDEYMEFEQNLSDDSFLSVKLTQLRLVGGYDWRYGVKSLVKRVMSRDVMANLNMQGHSKGTNKKIKFADSKVYRRHLHLDY
nr:uncharacterized protein LOC124815005 [Hydra vulgaris]